MGLTIQETVRHDIYDLHEIICDVWIGVHGFSFIYSLQLSGAMIAYDEDNANYW